MVISSTPQKYKWQLLSKKIDIIRIFSKDYSQVYITTEIFEF